MTARAMPVWAFVLLASWCHPGTAGAQERFPRVQYLAGRPELVKPTEITLVLDNRELRAEQTVYSDRGSSVRTAFSIPLVSIIAVGASPQAETTDLVLTDPSGLASALNREEYVTLTLQSGDRIEAVLFKVERQQSAAIAAKIESAADRAFDAPISRPAKARSVRSPRRTVRVVRVVGRTAAPRRTGFRKSRRRHHWRAATDRRYIEQT